MHPLNPDALYFSILLCPTPDEFTRQVKSTATQWVKIFTRLSDDFEFWSEMYDDVRWHSVQFGSEISLNDAN
jgi:hypothetical protein